MENNQLKQLIESDSSSRDFFFSLPDGLRERLADGHGEAFEQLKECAQLYSHETGQEDFSFEYYSPACSANDCTGHVQRGERLSEEEFDCCKKIYPFANPPM